MASRRRLAHEIAELIETKMQELMKEVCPELLCQVLEAVNDTGTAAMLVGTQWHDVQDDLTDMLELHFPEQQYVSIHTEAGIIHGVRLFHSLDEAQKYNEELLRGFDTGRWASIEDYNEHSYGDITIEEVSVDVRETNEDSS